MYTRADQSQLMRAEECGLVQNVVEAEQGRREIAMAT